jgi:hypothetical protein
MMGRVRPLVVEEQLMPVHDWTRVSAGTFHDFHCSWVLEIKRALNRDLLPRNYYAMAEQVAGGLTPDVLALHGDRPPGEGGGAATLVAEKPPKVSFTATTETEAYAARRNQLVIRHTSGDEIVALIEIVSPGNKGSRHALRSFLDKAVASLASGVHLLLLDVHPPGPRDPQGIHGALWDEIGSTPYTLPADKPLTLAAYSAGVVTTAYVEPVAVGATLPDMPLFLREGAYVMVPLERTYSISYDDVPWRYREVLEGKSPP